MSKFGVTYERSFPFESAHFNGAEQYLALQTVIAHRQRWGDQTFRDFETDAPPAVTVREHVLMVDLLLAAMESTHGHNFVADVFLGVEEMRGRWLDHAPYVIADEELAAVIEVYNRVNLSVSPGMDAYRMGNAQEAVLRIFARGATTEWLAETFSTKIGRLMLERTQPLRNRDPVGPCSGNVCLRVTVHETNGIKASSEKWLYNVAPLEA